MVWIQPRKRSSSLHTQALSKYKDVEVLEFFRLQQRKKTNKPHPFRITTWWGEYPFYEIAYGETEDEIRGNEWNYIKTVIEGEKKSELKSFSPSKRREWILDHFKARGADKVLHHSDDDSEEDGPSRNNAASAGPVKTPRSSTAGLPDGSPSTARRKNSGDITPTPSRPESVVSSRRGSGNTPRPAAGGSSGSSNSSTSSSSSSCGSASSGSTNGPSGDSSVGRKKATRQTDPSRQKHKKDQGNLPIITCAVGVVLNMLLADFWFLRLCLSLCTMLFVLSCYFTWASHMWFKVNLNFYGLCSMLFSKDTKFKRKLVIPDMSDTTVTVTDSKRIFFLRHGESEWNSVFNKGLKVLFPRLFNGLINEILMLTSLDSVFYDSPLNAEGMTQADKLCAWLHKERSRGGEGAAGLLEGYSQEDTIVVTSPLRRAIGTAVIALRRRFKEKGEKLKILSCLSEISYNVDTIPLADEPGSCPDLAPLSNFCAPLQPKVSLQSDSFDTSENKGRKDLRASGQDRLLEFGAWCFKKERTQNVIIASGHSLWFRHFFRSFLPTQSKHPLKDNKIANTGIVSFTLQRFTSSQGITLYRVDPESITEVYIPKESKSS